MSPYNRFVSLVSSRRQPSIIRELLKILSTASPDMIPLSGGLPNPEKFPFKEFNVTLKTGAKIQIAGDDLHAALQYLPTNGHGELLTRLQSLQTTSHSLPSTAFSSGHLDLVTVNGSQDGLSKALEMVMNPGDSILLEDHTYFATPSVLDPYGCSFISVKGDSDGMRPDSLWSKLSQRGLPGAPGLPKAIYINPTGANPTGSIIPESRKLEILDICNEYDLLVLEDDPYYYMQFTEGDQPRERSFLGLDLMKNPHGNSRVLRFDSLSKIMSSGLRLGYVTGPKPLVERMVLHLQTSALHASSLSQVLLNELLKTWGEDGFYKHVGEVEDFYRVRRDAMNAAAERHLTGLCTWSVPQGGMFFWIKVNGVSDTWSMIMDRGLEKNIMLVPGRVFMPENAGLIPVRSQYLRASYSLAPIEKFDVAFERLADLIREEQEACLKREEVATPPAAMQEEETRRKAVEVLNV